jgi:hypothetical protein
MHREDTRDTLLSLLLLAIPVVPVALYEMEVGSLLERLGATLALWAITCALCFGTVRVVTSRALLGATALALALLALYGLHLGGVFEAVGL